LTIAEYAAAVGDLLDTLRLRQVDVLGYQAGSLVAAELALSRPDQVRRAVFAGMPVFDARERETFNARPWPGKAREDGAHLVEEWQRIRRSRGASAPLGRLAEDLGAALRAGDTAAWLPSAAANYAAGERLPLLRQPMLVLRAKDEFWEMTARADALLRDARRVDLDGHNGGLFDTGAAEVARYAREFLDR
jgi:pimeloyl-ACP methyl ester carboxylesterase